MIDSLTTGIDILDRKLDGGFPTGSIVSLCAEPASQSELLLYQLTDTRDTTYLSTRRSASAVRLAIERTPAPSGSPEIHHVGGDEPLQGVCNHVEELTRESQLIVDTAGPLERAGGEDFQRFLNGLRRKLVQTDSVAVFHCLDGRRVPPARDATEHAADLILDLSTEVPRETLIHRLNVPKFRNGVMPDDSMKLDLSQQVSVDISRDIA